MELHTSDFWRHLVIRTQLFVPPGEWISLQKNHIKLNCYFFLLYFLLNLDR